MGYSARAGSAMGRVAIALALALAGCSEAGSGSRPVVRDSAGVRIVENGAADSPLDAVPVVVAEFVPPDSALTVVPWGAVVDRATGRVYLADEFTPRVVVFDATAKHVATLGRAGAGPGEFRDVSALAWHPDGVLVAWDAIRRILSRWTAEGELIAEEPAPLDYWGPGFAIGRDWIAAVTSVSSPSALEQALVRTDPDGTDTLATVVMEMSTLELPCGSFPGPKVAAPSVVWTSHADTVYVLDGPGYAIDQYAAGRYIGSVRRALPSISVDDSMAVAAVRSGPGPYGAFLERCGVTADQLVAAAGHAEQVSLVQSLAVDPAGRLWVTRSTDGIRPSSIDIFDADQAYLGTVTTASVPIAFLSDTTFVALHVEPSGRPATALWALRTRNR